jgi:hypothetical protein
MRMLIKDWTVTRQYELRRSATGGGHAMHHHDVLRSSYYTPPFNVLILEDT